MAWPTFAEKLVDAAVVYFEGGLPHQLVFETLKALALGGSSTVSIDNYGRMVALCFEPYGQILNEERLKIVLQPHFFVSLNSDEAYSKLSKVRWRLLVPPPPRDTLTEQCVPSCVRSTRPEWARTCCASRQTPNSQST